MHNLFVFGIGGTGARVIRALNMLLAANGGIYKDKDSDGNIVNETRVIPIIIDYDVNNGDKIRALDSLNSYVRLHKEIYVNEQKVKEGYFSTDIMEMRELLQNKGGKSSFNFQYNYPSGSTKFSDRIGFSALDGELQATGSLLSTLYNSSHNQEFAELYIDTTVGFRGNPNIGSVMLNSMRNTREFQEFSSLCGSEDKVVIIGSLFGGTGSSGIPVLVNAIRNSKSQDVHAVKIATVLVCPYFKIGSPEPEKRKYGVIDDKIFESKTKAALYYYQDALNSKIDAIYYLGDRSKNTLQHNIGEEEQKNPAHIVDFISALAVTHFNELDEITMKACDSRGNYQKHWKYGFNIDLDEVSTLDFSMFPEQSRIDVKRLIAFALAGFTVKENILNSNKDCANANFYKLSGLDKPVASKNQKEKHLSETLSHFVTFFNLFMEWTQELESGASHNLLGYDFNVKEICDLLKTHPFRKEKKGFFSKVVKEPTLRPSDIFSVMSQTYKSVHMQEGKDKDLNAQDTLTHAFFHSLYDACLKMVNEKLDLSK